MTATTASTEVAVVAITATERKDPHDEFGILELYENLTLTQKIVIGLLCAIVALEELYLFTLAIKYIAECVLSDDNVKKNGMSSE
ncbi:hypothetical protein PInf_014557 [Phytophthora infestans]|nr:hypothetical protein PInf_014557 [Phytophthora infestans]